MKFAGYDVIIIEGKAKSPVWLNIKDDKVSWKKPISYGGKRDARNYGRDLSIDQP